MHLQQCFPILESQFDLPPPTIHRADDLRGPHGLAHSGDIPAILEPLAGRCGRGSAFLLGHLLGAAPPLLHYLVGQARGNQTTRQSVFLPHLDVQIDDRVVGTVRQEVVRQPQGGRLVVGAQQYVPPFAQPTQAIRLLLSALAQGRQTNIAHVAQHEGARPERRDKRRRPGWSRCRALCEVPFVDHGGRVVIDQIDFHRGDAPTPSRPLKVLREFFMQATLRALFETDPAKRRQQGRWAVDAHGLAIRAESQRQHVVSIRVGVRAEEALVERVRGYDGLGIVLPEKVAEPVERHSGIVAHGCGHECDKILARERARRPLEKTALLGQCLQLVGGKHAGEFPFDFGGNVRTLSWHRHGDIPFLARDGRLGASKGCPHDIQKTKNQRVKHHSFVSLMQMGGCGAPGASWRVSGGRGPRGMSRRRWFCWWASCSMVVSCAICSR
jgi:hypothetical protein